MKFLCNVDLAGNKISNAVVILRESSTHLTEPVRGQIYYNTDLGKAQIYNGTDWNDLASADQTTVTWNTISGKPDVSASEVEEAVTQMHYKNEDYGTGEADFYLNYSSTVPQGNSPCSLIAKNFHTNGSPKHGSLTYDDSLGRWRSSRDLPETSEVLSHLIAGKYEIEITGTGTVSSFVIEHKMNSRSVIVGVREFASPYTQVHTTVEMTTINTVTLKFATAPALGLKYVVTVIG